MFVSGIKSKEEALKWAEGVLTSEIPFCPEVMEENVKKAIEILLTYLPDPYIGVTYKDQIFLKENLKKLVCSPAQAFDLIKK